MILLLGFAFLSGLITILAPCIWPLLPIILSSSVSGMGHKRPLGITLGIMLSFMVFTLAISYVVKLFHFDPNSLRLVAVIVIGFLGISMVIPAFSRLTEGLISKLIALFGRNPQNMGNDFGSGFITGLSLGIVWSPCAGPILAAIAALAATGQVTFFVVLITFFYVLGVGVPLFIFAYTGQQFFTKVKFVSKHLGRIQQVFGVIMILTAIAIYTNYDQYLQTQLLNMFPQINTTLDSFETSSTVKQQLDALKGQMPSSKPSVNTNGLFNTDTPAPDFIGITHWLNTNKPISIQSLRGKVVLVDFWTYTCINCIRTLPHVTTWYNKYKNLGFVVVGIHTPEFQFEHDTANVENAIKMYNIHYPVGQDNNYATWNNYSNEYWPAEYLIDAKGVIRREEFGEGEYDQTEAAIQELLKENGKTVTTSLSSTPDTTPKEQISPETYLGSKRMQFYFPDGSLENGIQTFSPTSTPPVNSFTYAGTWNITDEAAITQADSVITYHFSANNVYIILNPGTNAPNTATVKVFLDGNPISTSVSGNDVKNGVVTIDTDRLYGIVNLHGNAGDHTLRLEFQNPDIQAYTFTFG